jgi:predicted nucleic acid-binding protein
MESEFIGGRPVLFSSISLAEIVYLVEKGKIGPDLFDRLLNQLRLPNPPWVEVAFDSHVADVMRQIPRAAVPDLPDRAIAATALHLKFPLVTRDPKIRAALANTIW